MYIHTVIFYGRYQNLKVSILLKYKVISSYMSIMAKHRHTVVSIHINFKEERERERGGGLYTLKEIISHTD